MKIWELAERGATEGECVAAFLRVREFAVSSGVSIRELLYLPRKKQQSPAIAKPIIKVVYRDRWSVLQFGKHKGKRLNEADRTYLAWLARQDFVWSEYPELGSEIDEFLKER